MIETDASILGWVPLLIAVAAGFTVCTPLSGPLDAFVTRIAIALFGDEVERIRRPERVEALEAAHLPTSYRVYAAKTLFYTAVFAFAGSLVGVYLLLGALRALVWFVTDRLALPPPLDSFFEPAFVLEVPAVRLFGLLLLSGATFGLASGVLTYWLRWRIPAHLASNRRRRIDASLPRTIAFVYALSRSGMAFPEVMRVLAANHAVYGDAADEVNVAVNEMELFGVDVVSAIGEMARRTPSEHFEEFAENLESVLQSGGSLAEFLREQYDRYRQEAEAQQRQLLTLLATLAEVYVTVLVAGPLFLLTILVILGLAVADTLPTVRLVGYVVLPLANLLFIVYLSTVTESLRGGRSGGVPSDPFGGVANVRRLGGATSAGAEAESRAVADGGRDATAAANRERLAAYERFRGIRRGLRRPLRTLIHRPILLLGLTVPIATLVTLGRLPNAFVDGSVDVRVLDDYLVQATLFVVGSYAIVEEVRRRRLRRIEAIVPDFLDRLASINEAGMPVVESIGRVRRSELGELDPEIDRLWRDIEWGADLETALYRFERRIRTLPITRVVTLVTNATAASGAIAPVLRIAADQAQADRRLERQRRQELFTYVVVIYLSFFVFLVIIFALNNVLIPSLPETIPGAGGASPAITGTVASREFDPDAYTLVFFHTALIQSVLSGLIAGQMDDGRLRDGARHASVLLAVAYAGFLLIG